MTQDEAFAPKGPIAFDVPDPLVTPSFRDLVFTTYSGLTRGENEPAAIKMMAYILFGTFFDKDAAKDERRLVAGQTEVAVIEGRKSVAFYSSGPFLEWFDKNVLPLNILEADHRQGQARSIAPNISKEIWEALKYEPIMEMGKVAFSSGKPRVSSKVKSKRLELEENQRAVMAAVPRTHPARPLVDYLLHDRQKAQVTFKKVLRSNQEGLIDYVKNLPTRADVDESHWNSRKGRTTRIIQRIFVDYDDVIKLYYNYSPKTPRISALGLHIHSLPREARKIALKGTYECDLRACQLAVIAKLWEIPELDKILRDDSRDFWTVLLDDLGMSRSEKPIAKKAIYSSIFGMSKRHVSENMDEEDWFDDGYAKNFRKHPIINIIFKQRRIKRKQMQEEGGFRDAFHVWHRFSPQTSGFRNGYKGILSGMAYQAQSYELKIMLSILDILRKEEQIYLLLWLHDGVYLALHKESKKDQWLVRLKSAVQREAEREGIYTQLECERI